jgi:inhibitor of KinA sporulation pathway (predicted exonuclease)
MKMMALDLEMAQPSNNIIQIGAVIGDIYTGEIVGKFNIITKLPNEEQLSPYIINLTGITQEQVDKAPHLQDAYCKLIEFYTLYQPCNRIVLTWGGEDMNTLRSQLYPDTHWPFGRRWTDVKTLCIVDRIKQKKSFKGGLSKTVKQLGLNFEGIAHNAEADALNTFKVFSYLINKQGE